MKLAISNIAWEASRDAAVYELMKKYGFTGLEIAPTRIFPENPYDKLIESRVWAKELKNTYEFSIPSMQSIWFGRQEKMFGSSEEREDLLSYTKKAVDFAESIGCRNLVFGCPRNRYMPEGADIQDAVAFFKEIGDYAAAHGTIIGIEANPPIYNTNFINDTQSALEMIEKVDSEGFLLNLDVGTMIQNNENVKGLTEKVHLINHVHISEPGLKLVEKRLIHKELKELLIKEEYQGYISIEMGKTEELCSIENTMSYIKEVFD